MKIEVTVSVGLVGCKVARVFEIDDLEFEDMTENEKEDFITELAKEEMFELIEWNWKEK